MTDAELTRALERCEAPEAGFRHRDHLRIAWVYLQEAGSADGALERMATTLRRFTASVGKAEKYSDAVTAFWMYQLAAARAVVDGDLAAVLRAYPRLLDKELIDAARSGSADPQGDASDRAVPGRPA